MEILRKVLVSGSSGFIGTNLCGFLSEAGMEVIRTPGNMHNESSGIDPFLGESVKEFLSRVRPSAIVNLIGTSSEPNPSELFRVNVIPSLVLLKAIADLQINCRVLLMGSAAEYGTRRESEGPVAESAQPAPVSQYGVSKYAQSLACLTYAGQFGIDLMIARPFNIIGPGMPAQMVPMTFLLKLLVNHDGILYTGNLDGVRDYLSISDVTRALYAILQHGSPGEVYNVCSGIGWSTRQVLNFIKEHQHIPSFELREANTFFRRDDVKYSVGDNSKLLSLGWNWQLDVRVCIDGLIDTLIEQESQRTIG